MGLYIVISAVIVFMAGLVAIAFETLNHKFPSDKRRLANDST